MEALGSQPHEGNTWRSGVRSTLHAAGQLPQEGGPLKLLHLHVNQKPDDDDDDYNDDFSERSSCPTFFLLLWVE